MGNATALALLLAVAAPVASGAQPAQGQSVQQQFDVATAASDAGNWAEALRLFEALEARTTNVRTLALVRVRKGAILVELGRLEEAAASIRAGLPGIPADDATLDADRFVGVYSLGRIAEHGLDYAEALSLYRRAAAIPVADLDRLHAQRGIIQTQLFTDAPGAIQAAEAALRLIASAAPGNRALQGQFHTLKGRALLNLGRFPDTRRELQTALRLLGNLTMRVDRSDLLARSDLAIAALLAGDPDDARRYLAYTGAGRFAEGYIALSPDVAQPPCSGTLTPDDVAVIELFVGADGGIGNVTPVYASRQGPAAIALARAARAWSFDPEGARRVPVLFRSVVRLEVRCSKDASLIRFFGNVHAVQWRLAAANPAWAAALAAQTNRPAAALRAELAALERRGDPEAQTMLTLLLALAGRGDVESPEREALLRRSLPIADALDVPPAVSAAIALAIGHEQLVEDNDRDRPRDFDYEALLALPEIARSPEAAAFVRLANGRRHYRADELNDAAAIFAGVRAMPEARSGGPLATEALELEAAVHAARGDMAAARSAFEARGTETGPCGLPPRLQRFRASSNDFPNDAQRWGFEGWATSEIAVAPNGRAVETRTVVAYPPFVFAESAREIAGRNRYEPFYSPRGEPCIVGTQKVTFRLPE